MYIIISSLKVLMVGLIYVIGWNTSIIFADASLSTLSFEEKLFGPYGVLALSAICLYVMAKVVIYLHKENRRLTKDEIDRLKDEINRLKEKN
jgi:hypothetical protein